jgi:hypothetical protein
VRGAVVSGVCSAVVSGALVVAGTCAGCSTPVSDVVVVAVPGTSGRMLR